MLGNFAQVDIFIRNLNHLATFGGTFSKTSNQ